MKRLTEALFPLFFALFALGAFWLVAYFGAGHNDGRIAAMVFCAALAWCAMTWFRSRRFRAWKIFLVVTAVIAAVALVELSSVPAERLAQYRIVYELIALGAVLIQLYFIIEQKKKKD